MTLATYNEQAPDPSRRVAARDADAVARATTTALTRIMDAWRVRNADAAALAGMSARTWERVRSGAWSGRLNQDQLHRASGLIGLYKALHLYFSDALANEWPSLANDGPSFGGRRPLDIMVEGGLPTIVEIRAHVDALRGGV